MTSHKRFDPDTHYAIQETHSDAAIGCVKRGAKHGDPQFGSPESVEKVLDSLDPHMK